MLSWVFIYLAAFGLSDIFVKHYVKNVETRVFYYCLIGFIGYILHTHIKR